MPYTLFSSFVTACKDAPETVMVKHDPKKYARDVYKLDTEAELKQYIGNYRLQDVQHINKDVWRNNPDKSHTLYVNDYDCLMQGQLCYVAIIFIDIMKGKTVNKWQLKSFHEQAKPDRQRTIGPQTRTKRISGRGNNV